MAQVVEEPKTLQKCIQLLFRSIKESLKSTCYLAAYAVKQFFCEIHEMEQIFIKVNFMFTLLCQIIFFTMLDVVVINEKCLKEDRNVITGSSALLLYTILAFFIAKVKDVVDNYWTYSYGAINLVRLFFHCLWKILIELSRAISIVLCLKDCKTVYNFNFLYTMLSFSYYASTEKVFMDVFISIASYLKYSRFDSMEHLYIPIILKTYSILSAFTISGILLFGQYARFVMFASYFIIYLRIKDLYFNYVKTLILQQTIYESFKEASCEEIKQWDDVCAICLSRMDMAKVTSCKHLFHPLCVKQCLKTSLQCPLCKQMFVS